MVPKSQERHGITSGTIKLPISFHWKTHYLSGAVMEGACLFFECVARMVVFLLMQVALREREWSSLTGLRRGWWVVTLQPPSTPCAWAYSVMKWPVSWRSKQWVYSTWSEISVKTRLNIIPLIQSCSPSFFPSYFFLLCLPSSLPFFLSLSLFFTFQSSLMFSCTCFYKISYVIVHVWSEHHPFFHWNHFGFINYSINLHVIKGFWCLLCFEFFCAEFNLIF